MAKLSFFQMLVNYIIKLSDPSDLQQFVATKKCKLTEDDGSSKVVQYGSINFTLQYILLIFILLYTAVLLICLFSSQVKVCSSTFIHFNRSRFLKAEAKTSRTFGVAPDRCKRHNQQLFSLSAPCIEIWQ